MWWQQQCASSMGVARGALVVHDGVLNAGRKSQQTSVHLGMANKKKENRQSHSYNVKTHRQ